MLSGLSSNLSLWCRRRANCSTCWCRRHCLAHRKKRSFSSICWMRTWNLRMLSASKRWLMLIRRLCRVRPRMRGCKLHRRPLCRRLKHNTRHINATWSSSWHRSICRSFSRFCSYLSSRISWFEFMRKRFHSSVKALKTAKPWSCKTLKTTLTRRRKYTKNLLRCVSFSHRSRTATIALSSRLKSKLSRWSNRKSCSL